MTNNNERTNQHMDTGFPKKFLLQILRRFAFCLIPSTLLFLWPGVDIGGVMRTHPYLFFAVGVVLGALFFAIYTNFLTNQDLYWSYQVRQPKKMFVTLVSIVLTLLVIDLATFGLLYAMPSKTYTAIISCFVIGISSCALPFFILELIFTIVEHNKYSCKKCNLTCVGNKEDKVLKSEWKEYAHTTTGTHTDKYKVNGIDVNVTYDTGPETTYTGSGTVIGTTTYTCKVCGAMIKRRSYTKHSGSKILYQIYGGK